MAQEIAFSARITKGICGSVAINDLVEKWQQDGSSSDWVFMDIEHCSASDWVEELEGSDSQPREFIVSGFADCCSDVIDAYSGITYAKAQ